MTSREKFEAWVKFHLDDKFTEVPLYRGNGGLNYLDSQVDLAWIAWQAAEADMAVQFANAESKCRELAAENEKQKTHSEAMAVDNAALREVVERMVNQFAMSGISPEEKSVNPAKSLMFDAKSALFMPATDAFLAEVRAQGVEMFAEMYACEAIKDGDVEGWKSKVSNAASEYATQLRQGAAK